jgi:mannose-6-phosphate isomerase-like protein (cupin superfamily)
MDIVAEDGTFLVEAGGAYAIPRGVPHRVAVVEEAVSARVRTMALPART